MIEYTRQDIVNELGEDIVRSAEVILSSMIRDRLAYYVWNFYDAPKPLRDVCSFAGGDEDWIVLTQNVEEVSKNDECCLPEWIEAMSSCRVPDVYRFDGFVVYVGSH